MREQSKSLWERPTVSLLDMVMRRDRVRGAALKALEKQIYHELIERNPDRCPIRS